MIWNFIDAEFGLAAEKARQGFHFMNCGADIVAVTSWMSQEMEKLASLISGAEADSDA